MTTHQMTLDNARISSGRGPRLRGYPLRTALVAVVTMVAIGALAGCGGASSTGAATGSPKPDTTAATDSTVATSDGTSSKAPYTDAEACAWLQENLSKVPDTKVGAMAQLTIGLSAFFENHGGLQNADGYALDAAFARGCPALHARALKKAGIESFGDL